MAHTTPNANLPVPDLTDVPNGPTAFSNIATVLDSITVPTFASVTARDAAITSPVDGQVCSVSSTQGPSRTFRYNSNLSKWMMQTQSLVLGSTLNLASQTTPQVINDTRIQLEEGATYTFYIHFMTTTPAAIGTIVSLICPTAIGSPVFSIAGIRDRLGSTTFVGFGPTAGGLQSAVSPIAIATIDSQGGTVGMLAVHGSLVLGSGMGGVWSLGWSQSASNASNITAWGSGCFWTLEQAR